MSELPEGSGLLQLPRSRGFQLLSLAVLPFLIAFWARLVNVEVPEPYLDEVFHVGQAQKYHDGKYLEWDPKITTPPGLYVVSTILSRIFNWATTSGLRAVNGLLLHVLVQLAARVESRTMSNATSTREAQISNSISHTALNVGLFPPLFFFSALFYTDIASTVSVMLCWNHFVNTQLYGDPTVFQDLITVLLGIASLCFRQTNIFWVSVFPAAIILISKIDLAERETRPKDRLYDPDVGNANIEDYAHFVVSLIRRISQQTLSLMNGDFALLRLGRLLVPYATIMVAFLGFIAWNGSVVLGDKSNHVATIHLAQLLYLCIFVGFFSFPLMTPIILKGIFNLLSSLADALSRKGPIKFARADLQVKAASTLAFLTLILLIIHFNTIVHPFTLADNRHYTFYVFRYLLKYQIVKYLAAPIYLFFGWAAISVMDSANGNANLADQSRPMKSGKATVAGETPQRDASCLKINNAAAGENVTVGFVLVWMGVSALQLVTAPLVEPRYFILPWLMWRLRVPVGPSSAQEANSSKGSQIRIGSKSKLENEQSATDGRLWAETAWFLVINAVTGYIFLTKPFSWPQEPGRAQRFMW